jgi:hypothetical protein
MPTNQAFAGLLNPASIRTDANFGIRRTDLLLDVIDKKDGILVHHPKNDSWTISGMPLLCQTDPTVNAPLDKMLKTIPADQMPQKRGADGKPIIQNGKAVRYSVEEFREALKQYGCYNTSIVTVIITALANRASDLKKALTNRTKLFDEIKATPGVKKEINQLAWAYMQQTLCEIGSTVNGKVVQPHYFHEVVADLAGGSINEKCDPYVYGNCSVASVQGNDAKAFRTFNPSPAQLTNDIIIKLMKGGTIPMIAYNRHTPTPITSPGSSANKGYTFKNNSSFHKVVFNGFQPGKYPLRIFDVGNGQAYNVRISSNLDELKFDFSKKSSDAAKFDPKFLNRPFLVYEGEDDKVNNLVFFIDHFDGLTIRHQNKLIVKKIDPKVKAKEIIIKNPILK